VEQAISKRLTNTTNARRRIYGDYKSLREAESTSEASTKPSEARLFPVKSDFMEGLCQLFYEHFLRFILYMEGGERIYLFPSFLFFDSPGAESFFLGSFLGRK
jgi:hypothetical protein